VKTVNYTEKAERLLGALKQKAKGYGPGTEGHEPGGQFEEVHREVPRLEQLRRVKRSGRQLSSEDSVELNELEQAEKAKFFELAERCQRKDGSLYGTRGKCRKGTPVAAPEGRAPKRFADNEAGKVAARGERAVKKALAEKVLADNAGPRALPKRVATLKKLAEGKLPEDKEKRQALYFAAQKRLGTRGLAVTHPEENRALVTLSNRLNNEFNSTSQLTREQVLNAVGTVN